MQIEPIGFFHCSENEKYEVPRQATDSDSLGFVQLKSGLQFEQALRDLDGFKRIWLIFGFNRNSHWQPMVRPQNIDRKVGVFATRAPYRPNAIGLSCVRVDHIDSLKIFVRGHDLLNETPIFDIKPYHPAADSFSRKDSVHPHCWLQPVEKWDVRWAPGALLKLQWLEKSGWKNLKKFVESQLERRPTDSSRKRVCPQSGAEGQFVLAYRTWRIRFSVGDFVDGFAGGGVQFLTIEDIYSGYDRNEVEANDFEDRYGDLNDHRQFNKTFPMSLGV